MSAEDFGAVELRGVREERLDEVSFCDFISFLFSFTDFFQTFLSFFLFWTS